MERKNHKIMEKRLGYEVQLNEFESVCLFLGCKVNIREKNLDGLNEYCKFAAAEKYPFDPKIGEIYGVYLDSSKKWVRGKLKEIYNHAEYTNYYLFLIDRGDCISVRKHYMQKLSACLEFPPLCMRIGLDGVLPDVTLCKKCILYITDILHKGLVYFKEKRTLNNIVFGNIVIVPTDKSESINLATALLSKGLVRESDDFESDVTQFCSEFKGFKEDLQLTLENQTSNKIQTKCSTNNESKTVPVDHANKKNVNKDTSLIQRSRKYECNVEKSSHRGESSPKKSLPDTGYSSEEDIHKEPFVHEDAYFVPAGYYPEKSKKSDKRHSRKEEIHIPRNYYQIMRERASHHRSKSQGNRESRQLEKNQSRPMTSRSVTRTLEKPQGRTDDQKRIVGQTQYSESEGSCSEKSSKKHVSWGNTLVQDCATTKPKGTQSQHKSLRAFNLNYKTANNTENAKNVLADINVSSCSQTCPEENKQFLQTQKNSAMQTIGNQIDPKSQSHYNKNQTGPENHITSKSGSFTNRVREEKDVQQGKSTVRELNIIEDDCQVQSRESSTTSCNTSVNTTFSSIDSAKMTKKQQLILKYKKANQGEENLKQTIMIGKEKNISEPIDNIKLRNDFEGLKILPCQNDRITSQIVQSVEPRNEGNKQKSVVSSNDFTDLSQTQNLSSGSVSTLDSSNQTENTSGYSSGSANFKLTKKQKLIKKYKDLNNSVTSNTKNEVKPVNLGNLTVNTTISELQNPTVQEAVEELSHEQYKAQRREMSSPSDNISHQDVVENYERCKNVFSEEEDKRQRANKLMAPTEKILDDEYNTLKVNYPVQRLLNKLNIAAGVLVHTGDTQPVSAVTTLSESKLDPAIIRALED